MDRDWLIDLLMDVNEAAQKRGLLHLSDVLDDAVIIATFEIKAHSELRQYSQGDYDNQGGNFPRTTSGV